MAEPTTFPEEHVTPPTVYRKVSGMAIASLTLALLFGLWLVVLGIWSFRDHSPLLLPIWLQMVPVVSAALALAALYLIRHSEGTLAGARLAGWGWWLAVILGLGYWAYYGATYFAVVQQADAFTQGWFAKMAQREFAAAFLDLQEPAQRLNVNPKDIQEINRKFARWAQMLSKDTVPVPASEAMRTTDLGRILNQAGTDSQITPLGVFDWGFKEGIYAVKRQYRVTTPEGEWHVRVTVQGMESRNNEFQGRQWFVVPGETSMRFGDGGTGLTGQWNPKGQQIAQLAQQAAGFMQSWGTKLFERKLEDAYLDTREPGERAKIRAEFERGAILAALATAPAPVGPVPGAMLLHALSPIDSELDREVYLRDYFDLFARRSLLHTEDLYLDDQALRPLVVRGVNRLLGSREEGPPCGGMQPGGVSSRYPWVYDEQTGRLQVSYELRIGFPPLEPNTSPIMAKAVATLQSHPEATAGQQKGLNWQILRLDLLGAGDVSRSSPSGRRRSMPPPPILPGP